MIMQHMIHTIANIRYTVVSVESSIDLYILRSERLSDFTALLFSLNSSTNFTESVSVTAVMKLYLPFAPIRSFMYSYGISIINLLSVS